MRTGRIDEVMLQKYLFGTLSEQEQVQVEDRAFADSEYLEAIEAAEADLIDAYVRGELSPADRRQFEARFFLSPQRRSKVEFARTLARVATESQIVPLAPERPSMWQSFIAVVRAWNPAMQIAAVAAVLLLVASVSWLGIQNVAMRSRMATFQAQERAAESREAELRQQLAQEQSRAANPAPQSQKPPAGGGHTPLLATLVFLPNVSRAASNVQQLTLNSGVQLARLEIQLEARDDFPRFRAELHTRAGDEVLVRGNLTPRRAGGGYVVSFDVPATALPAGEYELALKGATGNQTTDIGYYYFRVRRQSPVAESGTGR
jgi:hypothetical protein